MKKARPHNHSILPTANSVLTGISPESNGVMRAMGSGLVIYSSVAIINYDKARLNPRLAYVIF